MPINDRADDGSAAASRPATDIAGHLAGSDAPERTRVRIGYLPLTDCAPIVMAPVLGFDVRRGVAIEPVRLNSWASLRDQLLAGAIDLAHVLHGLVVGLQVGLGGPRHGMAVLMVLSRNGQAITLSRRMADRGLGDAASLARAVGAAEQPPTFAQTFPTGTHAMWLYHWLASAGVHPLRDARIVTVPPPQMVRAMGQGQVDGFSAGEPWNHRAVLDGVGVTAATSQQVWPDHPEKVLGCTAEFADRHPHTCRAVVQAVLEAGRWIDAGTDHRSVTAERLSRPEHLDTPVGAILPRMLGRYQDGRGRSWDDAHPMAFHGDGAVNFPYLSDAMWFLTQYRRWGLLAEHPDYERTARALHRLDLYREAAQGVAVPVPASPLRSSRLIDGSPWDGSNPAAYADGFALHARTAPACT